MKTGVQKVCNDLISLDTGFRRYDGLGDFSAVLKRDGAMEKQEKFGVFGAALDALDLPEKVALKQAYVRSMQNRSTVATCTGSPPEAEAVHVPGILDPYDAVKAALADEPLVSSSVEWMGKLAVESWLTPRPSVNDAGLLQGNRYTEFLDGNGCYAYSRRVKSYLEEHVFPLRPVMIGIDHSLTGGVLQYLAAYHENANILIFDSHTDMVDFSTKKMTLLSSPQNKRADTACNIYECGSFIDHLLAEEVIRPDRVWILGTQDLPERANTGATDAYVRKLEGWAKRGVHLISKEELVREGIPKEIAGPTYISIDIDLGSYACVFACRFMDRVGLEYDGIIVIFYSL